MVIASVRTFSSVARLAVMMAIVPDSNRTWTLATSVTGECTAAPWPASRRGGEATRPSTMSMSWVMRSITTVSFCTRDANGPRGRARGVRVDHADQLDVRELGVHEHVVLAHVAGADDAGAHLRPVGHQPVISSGSSMEPSAPFTIP